MPLNYAAVVSHAYLHASELLQFVFPVDVMCWLSSPNIEKCSRYLSGPRIILDFIETRQIALRVYGKVVLGRAVASIDYRSSIDLV